MRQNLVFIKVRPLLLFLSVSFCIYLVGTTSTGNAISLLLSVCAIFQKNRFLKVFLVNNM